MSRPHPTPAGSGNSWAGVVGEGRWTDFRGLPPQLSETDLLSGLNQQPGPHPRRPAMLGRRRCSLVSLDRLRYWVSASSNVVLVEVADPGTVLAPASLLAALGPPDREGDGRYRRIGASTTEYVYTSRGLAVTIAESYDDPPSFAPELAAVLLFAPTDLRGFVLELGGNDRGGPRL